MAIKMCPECKGNCSILKPCGNTYLALKCPNCEGRGEVYTAMEQGENKMGSKYHPTIVEIIHGYLDREDATRHWVHTCPCSKINDRCQPGFDCVNIKEIKKKQLEEKLATLKKEQDQITKELLDLLGNKRFCNTCKFGPTEETVCVHSNPDGRCIHYSPAIKEVIKETDCRTCKLATRSNGIIICTLFNTPGGKLCPLYKERD